MMLRGRSLHRGRKNNQMDKDNTMFIFDIICIITMHHTINKLLRYSFSTSGHLMTWGETTYGWGRPHSRNLREPGFVQQFHDVTHVAAGQYHMLFNTTGNQIFSVGLGSHGRLGLGSTNSKDVPQSIEQLRGVDVKQLITGNRHSLALTHSGDLYSWGYGGNRGLISSVTSIFDVASPLGHLKPGNMLTPALIQTIDFKVLHATAGKDFSLAIGSSGKVFGWGAGISSLSENPYPTPSELNEINYFLDSHHVNVVKMRAVDEFVFFLLDDGSLYTLGTNEAGVLGTRKNQRIVDDNHLPKLTKVIDEEYKGDKIVDFEVSANSLIFRTESGKIFFSGMDVKYKPGKFPADVNVRKMFATYDSVGVVTEEGKIIFLNDQFIEDSDANQKGWFVSDDQNLKKGVLELGGTHQLRYALVRH